MERRAHSSSQFDESVESGRGLVLPGPARVLRIFGRALTLRCPHCGGGPVLRHWFRMRERCGRCGLRVERGEGDYFIGSMMFNLVLSEGLFAIGLVAALLATWPVVPWDTLEWLAPLLMLVAPFLLFPFSKLVWLGFDTILRPVSADELQG